jgi:hypothetical protein
VFLEEKLSNFRKFLEPLCLTDEHKAYLRTFNDLDRSTDEHKAYLEKFADLDSTMPYLLQCVALQKAGKLDAAVDQLCAALPASPAVVDKVKRYLTMFVDVLTF